MNVGSDLTHVDLARLTARSVDLIDRHQSPSGAYPASPTFSAYRGYAWLRDGAFIAEGMSRVAGPTGPSAFHTWCARVVGARASQVTDLTHRASRGLPVTPADMLPTRFTLDGSNGTDAWWDHQLDGYGTWLWSLDLHLRRHPTDIPGAPEAVRIATHYLTTFWHQPCYDWWEEHVDQRHVSTLAAIHAGLRAAINLGALTRPLTEAAEEAIEGIATLISKEGVVESVTAPGGVTAQVTAPGRVTGQTTTPGSATDQITAQGSEADPTTTPGNEASQTTVPGNTTGQTTTPGSEAGQATGGTTMPRLPIRPATTAMTGAGGARGETKGWVGGRTHLTKWLGSDAVDGSLLACVEPFGLYSADHPVAVGTVAAVEESLADGYGVYRYLEDTFYGGGRWVLLAGFLGLNHVAAGRPGEAMACLRWMAAQADADGELPEQVSDRLLAPVRRQEWVERWGPVASPLLWSHGMYLMLADELGVVA